MSTASEAEKRGLQPIGQLSWASVGVEPKYMRIGPVAAIQSALAKAGKTMSDMALVEINEAFSSQYLACERELGWIAVSPTSTLVASPLATRWLQVVPESRCICFTN